jgi:hypothetical protein
LDSAKLPHNFLIRQLPSLTMCLTHSPVPS